MGIFNKVVVPAAKKLTLGIFFLMVTVGLAVLWASALANVIGPGIVSLGLTFLGWVTIAVLCSSGWLWLYHHLDLGPPKE